MRNAGRLRLFVLLNTMVVLFVLLVAASASAAPSWSNTGGAISAEEINAVVVDSLHDVLYAAATKGVWRCDNPDTAPAWTSTGGAMSTQHASCLTYDGVHNRLYAGTDSGVWVCKNPNSSPVWSNTGGPPKISPARALAYDKVHNKLYAGSQGQGVWRCINPDTSHTWHSMGGTIKDSPVNSIVYDEVLNVVYAGTALSETVNPVNPDVWRCKNPGSATPTWKATGLGYEPVSLALDASLDILFAGSTNIQTEGLLPWPGLHRCSKPDTSPKWTHFKSSDGYDVDSMTVDASDHILYFSLFDIPAPPHHPGSGGHGVWSGPCSSDGVWKSSGEGLSNLMINSLCFDVKRGDLYAATGSGVWRYSTAKGASTFYFAEGTCRPGFDTYLTIQNPGKADAKVQITYMKGDASSVTQDITVPGNSRATVNAKDKLGEGDDTSHDFSAKVECTNGQSIIAERPMYFNYKGMWNGGHDILGAPAPASTFYFAEGSCRTDYDTYLCIQNPGADTSKVMITYMRGDGSKVKKGLTVKPQARATVGAKDVLGQGDDAAHDFSAKVETTDGTSIVCERPMYFNYGGKWTGGSDVIGALMPAQTFYFAEGTCRPGFDPYLCILSPLADNPSYNMEAKITYFKGDGTTQTQTVGIKKYRTTVNVKEKLGEGDDTAHDFSCRIDATGNLLYPPIMCERPMYFNYNGAWDGGHDVVGAMAPATTFYFAEGTCRPGFDPFISIQNPGKKDADVTITYMKGDGKVVTQTLTVAKGSRSTVTVKHKLGEGDDPAHDFSAKVECTNGQNMLCERPMYFNYNGTWTGGSDVIGLH